MTNAAKRVFTCKDRCRYSRKRATFCRRFAKKWQLPYGSAQALLSNCLRSGFTGICDARTGVPVYLYMHFRKCIFQKCIFRKCIFRKCIFRKFANFWRARSRLYQNEILQENMRSTSFFKLYKICILLHRCNLKIFAKNRFEKTAIFVKFQQKIKN